VTGVREWWQRHLSRGGQAPVPVRVVGRAALGAAHAVFVLEIEGRRMVVGVSPQTITSLGELTSGVAPLGASADGCAESRG